MDWENERYVRVYTRDTMAWRRLPFHARAAFLLLLRKVDRAGVLDLDGYDAGDVVATVCDVPDEYASDAVSSLVRAGMIEVTETAIVVPNFTEAQEARQSDRQRQRESRARRKARALSQTVTDSHEASQTVTDSHEASQPVADVTDSHPSLAEPSLAEPERGHSPPGFKAGTTHLEAKLARAFEAITGLPPSSRTLGFALDVIRDGYGTEAEVLGVLGAIECKRTDTPPDLTELWWKKNWERTKRRYLHEPKAKLEEPEPARKPSPGERARTLELLKDADARMRGRA